MIPDGPLHPTDLVVAALFGVLVAALFGRRRWWLATAVVAALTGYAQRHGWMPLVDAVVDRPRPLLAGAAVAAAVPGGRMWAAALGRENVVVAVLVVACGAVWAVVPDTEAPLMVGATLSVAALGSGLQRGAEPSPGWTAGPAVAAVVLAAAVGTVGRPGRFDDALVAVGVVLVVSGLVAATARLALSGRGRRPQSARA